MMKRVRWAAPALVFLATAAPLGAQEEELLSAPDFTLTDMYGDKVRLSDYAGRNVVLWFYPRANTPG